LEKLREIVAAARIKPAVVQVESDLSLPEWQLLDFCREQGIVLLALPRWDTGWIRNCWLTL